MKFSQFRKLQEAKRVETPGPKINTPERQAVMAPGDVGMVDRLTQMDKDKKRKVQIRNVAGRMAQGYDRNIAGVQDNNADQPELKTVDRDYSKRGQYIDRVRQLRGPEAQPSPEDTEIDPKYDPDSPDYVSQSRSPEEIQQAMAQGYKPGMDAVTSADRTMRDVVQDAQRGTLRDPINTQGIDPVDDPTNLRHGYQSSGVGINKVIGQDDLDYIFAATQDENPQFKDKDKSGNIDKRGVEDIKHFKPTARDLEALDPEAEKLAMQSKAYLTPEVAEYQGKLRKALETNDARAVQDLAFQHEVSSEMIDSFIDMHGKTPNGLDQLMKSLENAGGTAGNERWGGNLGPDAKKARVPGSPEGVYDISKLSKKQKAELKYNRTRKFIEIYLKQGGRNAYSPHEGIRSINDMDLEHVASLKGESKSDDGTAAGWDHPDNWVWAGQELNRTKGADYLTGPESPIEKYAQGEAGLEPEAYENIGRTWDDISADMTSREKEKFINAFGGDPTGGRNGQGSGNFSPSKMASMSKGQRRKNRQIAMDELGMSEDEASALFPDFVPQPDSRPNLPVYFNQAGQRFGGAPYVQDPEQYDLETTLEARDKTMRQVVIDRIKQQYGLNRVQAKAHPAYKDFERQMNASQGAITGVEDEI